MFSVLLSSTGLVVNKHFCLDQLQSISFFAAAESCSMGMDGERQCPPAHIQIKKKSCCEDQSEYFKLVEEVTPNNQELDIVKVNIEYSSVLLNQSANSSANRVADVEYALYKPPLTVCDITISIQTFLC